MLTRRALVLAATAGLATACGPKSSGAVQAPGSLSAQLLVLEEHYEDRTIEAVPDALAGALIDTVAARNLATTAVDTGSNAAVLGERRTTAHRLAWLAEQGDADILVMVVTRVRFYSQLTGRFRWTVSVEATVSMADAAQPETVQFDVPVFLQFHHEREPEALAAAASVIERRVGSLMDDWLGGL